MTNETQLKPCPFCGEIPSFKYREYEDTGGEIVSDCGSIDCENENCFLNWAIQPKDEMVHGWNTRAAPSPDRAKALEAWQRVNIHIQRLGGFIGWAKSTEDMQEIKAALSAPDFVAAAGEDETKIKDAIQSDISGIFIIFAENGNIRMWDKKPFAVRGKDGTRVEAKFYSVTPTSPALPVKGEYDAVFSELEKVVKKFPTWPTDPLHALAVLGEEYGELTKDTLQLVYEPHKTTMDSFKKEALQTAAMALRFYLSLEQYEFKRGEQHRQGRATQSVQDRNGASA